MKYPVITIAREHGSGGRVIAQKVGKKLDIPVYGKTIIDIAAQESGLAPDLIQNLDKRRASCRNMLSDTQWGDRRNYRLMLDSSPVLDFAASIIIDAARRREWKEEEGGAK